MQKIEVDRMNKEFLFNDYKRRFDITEKEILSVIVGYENSITELNKANRDKKEIMKKLKDCITFNFINSPKSTNSSTIDKCFNLKYKLTEKEK